ncbi:DUF6881 domain-containing protein [Nocardia sp. NPDC059091]|uniref:DUF6881 domain-containing protein n=1 Tax=unclassified Nocardia TaxID=2637762 RepID=UPI003681260C
MRYQKITTLSRTALESVLTFVEFNGEGMEWHKVEYFPSGGLGYCAFDYQSSAPTELFKDHAEAMSQIAFCTEYSVEAITPEAFRTEWLFATGEHEYAPNIPTAGSETDPAQTE